MKKNTKIYTSLMAGAMATIIAAGSVNAQIVEGYDSLKKSVKRSIVLDNATLEFSLKTSSGGITYAEERSTMRFDNKNKHSHVTNYYVNKETGTTTAYNTYVNQDMNINSYDENGEIYYNVYIDGFRNTNQDNMLQIPNKMIDILELSADTFIGSAKDHFVKEDLGADSLITGTFDKTQVPAIGNALISLMFSETSKSRYYSDPNVSYQPPADTFEGMIYNNQIEEGYINHVILDSSIDADGFLNYFDIQLQLVGKSKTGEEIPFEILFSVELSNKGTTTILFPEINKENDNVTWNDYTESNYVDYYDANQEIVDEYNERMNKVYEKMHTKIMTEEEKQNLLNALDAFESVLNGTSKQNDSSEQSDSSEQK